MYVCMYMARYTVLYENLTRVLLGLFGSTVTEWLEV